MKTTFYILITLFAVNFSSAQKVGIGVTTPVAKLDLRGVTSSPAIPGPTSTGIFRIGVSFNEGIDIGKMGSPPYTAWIQAGFADTIADPISLQPLGGNVGIGTSAPSSSAALEVSSTSQGFLPPRLTYVQRNSISNPVAGLVVWCSNCGVYGELQVYRGTGGWIKMDGTTASDPIQVGDSFEGGTVAYIFQPSDPGYVAGETHGFVTTLDFFDGEWGCMGIITNATGTSIGTGIMNTDSITFECPTPTIAAWQCRTFNFFGPWDLPSKDELNKIYINRNIIGIPGLDLFWSSSEVNSNSAWHQHFGTGAQGSTNKNVECQFAPIKYF